MERPFSRGRADLPAAGIRTWIIRENLHVREVAAIIREVDQSDVDHALAVLERDQEDAPELYTRAAR